MAAMLLHAAMRMAEIVQSHPEAPVELIRDRIFESIAAWSPGLAEDDMTALVLRRQRPERRDTIKATNKTTSYRPIEA